MILICSYIPEIQSQTKDLSDKFKLYPVIVNKIIPAGNKDGGGVLDGIDFPDFYEQIQRYTLSNALYESND